ncbi:AbiH family protein [Streptococcus cristatus]|uniref:AbiH family protein n=1 Tax=Streptococcus cristatus TaxID=45634 RepID=UPI001EF272E3|nr:AbiH family protein [Streptococcus cristatus]MCG7330626.1 CPBP family glutamic-type intramembrane protease [Streptococcus cristatus]
MKKLFVIGNGFDLAHGLKTSYLQFKRFVYQQAYNYKEIEEEENIPEIDVRFFYDFEIPDYLTGNHGEIVYNDQEVAGKYFELISSIVKYKEDWRDFENSLAKISDIEFELNSFYDSEEDIDYFRTANYIEDFSETLKNFYQYATNSLFSEWINTISKSEEYKSLLPIKESVLKSKGIAFSSKELNPAFPLGNLFVVFLSAVCVYGGEEELGWRGILQPTLETRFSFWISGLITGCIWAIWHVPLWFVIGSSQSRMPFILFSLFAIYLSILLAAVFKKTKSILYCAIFHGLINTLLSLFVIKINLLFILGLVGLLFFSHYLQRNS